MSGLMIGHAPIKPEIEPSDIIRGLGVADRRLLAMCLALFEDSTLSSRLKQLYGIASNREFNFEVQLT